MQKIQSNSLFNLLKRMRDALGKLNQWHYFSLILLVILVTSCSNDHNFRDIKSYINLVKQNIFAQKKKIPPLHIQVPVAIQYQASKLRDPFKDTFKIAAVKNRDNLNPLTNYPISMLKFLGTLDKNNIFYAYIFAPDNKMYQVKIGDSVGDQHGKVLHIYSDRVEISEAVDKTLSASPHIVTLLLKEKGE